MKSNISHQNKGGGGESGHLIGARLLPSGVLSGARLRLFVVERKISEESGVTKQEIMVRTAAVLFAGKLRRLAGLVLTPNAAPREQPQQPTQLPHPQQPAAPIHQTSSASSTVQIRKVK